MQLLKDIDLAACISLHMQKSPKKKPLGVYFDNMALYFQYRINKNALLQFCPRNTSIAISQYITVQEEFLGG